MDASLVISVGALGLAGASAFYADRTLREARKANALPTLLEFVQEYRRYEADRRYLLRDLRNEHDPKVGISGLPNDARERVVRVQHYLDQLGLLVDQQLVDAGAVAGFMGESVLRSWQALSPYITAERDIRGEDYAEYF